MQTITSAVSEEFLLLGYNAIFRRTTALTSSESKSKPDNILTKTRQQAERWFLACHNFDPEDGGDMFLRNFG
jgi:hypothetical protein